MPRKTIPVDLLKMQANSMLRSSITSSDTRYGVILLLENVLFNTGKYKGYRYLNESEVPKGYEPGIRTGISLPDEDLYNFIGNDPKFKNTDHTRREYF